MNAFSALLCAVIGVLIYELLRQVALLIAMLIGSHRRRKIEKQQAKLIAEEQERWRRKNLFFRNLAQIEQK